MVAEVNRQAGDPTASLQQAHTTGSRSEAIRSGSGSAKQSQIECAVLTTRYHALKNSRPVD
jgi:hypothetical protein